MPIWPSLPLDLKPSSGDLAPLQANQCASLTASVFLEVSWQCANATHSDNLALHHWDFSSDRLPLGLHDELRTCPIGQVVGFSAPADQLIRGYPTIEPYVIPVSQFNRNALNGIELKPSVGRFYPRSLIADMRDILITDPRPFRLLAADPDGYRIDLNHPLAGRQLSLNASIRYLDTLSSNSIPSPGRDAVALACNNGPGMQARWGQQAPQFLDDTAFIRADNNPDSDFYAQPRMVSHIDDTASATLGELYRQLIPAESEVLDLMTSLHSHLPPGHAAELIGLGMNHQEMHANPALTGYHVQDLNDSPRLPFANNRFDAVICSLSVEYSTRPLELFAEVARIIRPGGKFIVTFSDRCFPSKAIRLWSELHPFERVGLIADYFLCDGSYDALNTWSFRGLPRPPNDPYASQRNESDPLFAVWGTRKDND